jgi:hypothetical protein
MKTLDFRVLVNDIFIHKKINLDKEKLNFESQNGYKLGKLNIIINKTIF